ncbi:hypothetical protein ACWC3X_20250 [Streptomyces populi]
MSDTPVVERVDTAVSTVPTDAPEADPTLTRDSTTLVLAEEPARHDNRHRTRS